MFTKLFTLWTKPPVEIKVEWESTNTPIEFKIEETEDKPNNPLYAPIVPMDREHKCRPIRSPPQQYNEEHIIMQAKSNMLYKYDYPGYYLNKYLYNRKWKKCGLWLSWIEPIDKNKCYYKSALIRGDGKVLSTIDLEIREAGQDRKSTV